MSTLKLICLPYAGGTAASIYLPWKKRLSEYVDVLPLEMPGRGKRIRDSFKTSMKETIEDLMTEFTKMIETEEPYLLFGHSMGSLLAFELYHKALEEGLPVPESLIVSGGQPPQLIEHRQRNYHQLSKEDFTKEVIKSGQVREELFHNQVLLDLYISILYADYKLVETYRFVPKGRKFNRDIYCLIGKHDPVILEQSDLWSEHTDRKLNKLLFEGGHFFIHECEHEVLATVKDIVKSI